PNTLWRVLCSWTVDVMLHSATSCFARGFISLISRRSECHSSCSNARCILNSESPSYSRLSAISVGAYPRNKYLSIFPRNLRRNSISSSLSKPLYRDSPLRLLPFLRFHFTRLCPRALSMSYSRTTQESICHREVL